MEAWPHQTPEYLGKSFHYAECKSMATCSAQRRTMFNKMPDCLPSTLCPLWIRRQTPTGREEDLIVAAQWLARSSEIAGRIVRGNRHGAWRILAKNMWCIVISIA